MAWILNGTEKDFFVSINTVNILRIHEHQLNKNIEATYLTATLCVARYLARPEAIFIW